jgi:hypothetical protein
VYLLELNSLKLGRGFFGGEGFMQKIEGDGMAFVHSGGTLAKRTTSRRSAKVDGLSLVSLKRSITILNSLAESRTLSLEEKVYSMLPFAARNRLCTIVTFSRLADRIIASAPKAGGDSRGEGSTGGLGEFIDGDNRLKVSQFYTTFNPNLSS